MSYYPGWSNEWSNNTNAPQITRYEYIMEKATLTGSFIGSILYGTTIRASLYSRSFRLLGLF